MTIPIVAEEAGAPFTIGRSGGRRDPDFVLDGVGMQLHHCVIEDRGPEEGCYIQAACRGAVVLVNGETLQECGAFRKLEVRGYE